MAMNSGSNSRGSSLIFAYDMYNSKSWKGAPATNKVNPTNSYPDIGNSWGTYNTNQYNSNTFWSWGVVGSVSNNIVTFSSVSRTVHQYDVIRPQTSGGGLTANQDYIIRKINSTQFTIHVYNADQDGSEGYNVHNNVNNDSRVNISATNFPTNWWGAPHKPNAGLVKEIIPDGFKHQGRTHSCIRLNYDHRDAGGGLDGWAYGGSVPSSTAATTYCISWYRRAVDEKAVGSDPGFSMYSGGGWSLSRIQAVPLSTEWERVVYRGTPPASAGTNFYWWPSGSNSYEVSEIMWNEGSHPALYTEGTRSNTEALLDLTGRNTITATSLTYTDDGNFEFNGSNNYATLGVLSDAPVNSITCEAWIKPTRSSVGTGTVRGGVISANNTMYLGLFNSADGGNTFGMHWANKTTTSRPSSTNGSVPNNEWSHIVGTWDGSTSRAYVNGVEIWSSAQTGTIPSATYYIGTYGNALQDGVHNFNGNIGEAKVYNKALTAAEVKANYESTKVKYK